MTRQAETVFPSDFSSWAAGRISISGECLRWEGATVKGGYGTLTYKQKNYRAHRFAFAVAHGRLPVGMVLHSCDNRLCVNPGHLSEGGHSDNMRDMVVRGRSCRGEGKPNVVLNEEAVKVMRHYRSKGFTYRRIAEAYDISMWTVRSATTGKAWKYL